MFKAIYSKLINKKLTCCIKLSNKSIFANLVSAKFKASVNEGLSIKTIQPRCVCAKISGNTRIVEVLDVLK